VGSPKKVGLNPWFVKVRKSLPYPARQCESRGKGLPNLPFGKV